MTYLFDKAFQITLMILFLLIFLVLVLLGVFILSRAKRKNKKEEDDYYQNLDRYNGILQCEDDIFVDIEIYRDAIR